MKLIITRHAETQQTPKGYIKGHEPIRLSDKGWKQARRLAERLKDEQLDHIYSSDLVRAAETAHEIARHHKNIPFEFDPRLRERDFGELTGKQRQHHGIDADQSSVHLETNEGETLTDVHARVTDFITTLEEKHEHDTVLIVAHKTIQRAIHNSLQEKHPHEIKNKPGIGHTAIHIVEKTNDDWIEHVYDDTEHLT